MLSQLSVSFFRNIQQVDLSPAAGINLILGENGSGKTSLLEAIFMIAIGRSFRSRSLKHVVQKNQQRLTVFARTDDKTPVGLQYDLTAGLQIRLNNAPLKRLSDLAAHLPLQFIPANCHQFFELGPRYRRRMVDWGVFHVEHRFNYHWQSYKKVLQQRNAAIKQNKTNKEIQLWDNYLVEHGSKITQCREQYLRLLLERFLPLFQQLCPELEQAEFKLRYMQGWSKETDFSSLLKETIDRDRSLGYTRSGIHAADWSLRIDGADPYEMLSRGQQKLFFLALSMAQIILLAEKRDIKNSILLIDDLSSELDWNHQQTVISALRKLPVQAYISSTNLDLATLIDGGSEKLFHVKQGLVSDNQAMLSTQGQT